MSVPAARWVLDRVRQRLERGEKPPADMTLRDPSTEQREWVDRVLGRDRSSGTSISVNVARLDAILRNAQICDGLVHALELLEGLPVDRNALRRAAEEEWDVICTAAEKSCDGRVDLLAWLAEIRESRLLARASRSRAETASILIEACFGVARRLPAKRLHLAELAAAVTGDSHALDRGTPLAVIALRLAAHVGGCAHAEEIEAREIWANVGVLCDELSAPVLCLNLRAEGNSFTARQLRLSGEAGEATRLSTRQLVRDVLEFDTGALGRTVFICENPCVVAAAADRLGPRSQPMVCVEGQPKTAARELLAMLCGCGVRLLYHGDFDWPGLRIANLLVERHGVQAWRFSVADYLDSRQGPELEGRPIDSLLDSHLKAAMEARGYAVHEESCLGTLLSDVAR